MAAPALVLVHHQVIDPGDAPGAMAVHPERFAEQLEVLVRTVDVVPLAAIRDRSSGRPRVAITFDDGYADNVEVAAPLLAAAGLPATCFVTGWSLDADREFWWDELDHLLGPVGGATAVAPFETVLGGRRLRVELSDAAARERALIAITRRAYTATPDEIRAAMDALAEHLGVEVAMCDRHRHAGEAGIARLASVPGITIGAHTVRHATLPVLEPAARDAEIIDAKVRLEALIGRPVTQFAFPFGHAAAFDDACERAVASAGFDLAVRNVFGRVTSRTDPYRIPRAGVGDWDGDEFGARLARWLRGRAA